MTASGAGGKTSEKPGFSRLFELFENRRINQAWEAERVSKAGKILQETKRFEALLSENFGAQGADLAEKTSAAAGELPKGIVEKLLFLARLQSQAQAGEPISAADAKQAGYWIAAVRPYLDYGAARGKSDVLRRAVGLVALAIAAYYLYRVWKRRL